MYRVKAGNYIGQNFGLITEITETEVKLKEIVEDSNGDWVEGRVLLCSMSINRSRRNDRN